MAAYRFPDACRLVVESSSEVEGFDLLLSFAQRGDGALERLPAALGGAASRVADVAVGVEVVRQPTG